MAALVAAWWRLRTAAVTERWWWTTAALWFAPLVASVPLYSRDLYSYAAQGALWAEGLNPYEHGVSDLQSDWRESTAPTWLETPSPYGPVWLLIARGAATIAGDQLWLALLLLRLVAVAGTVALAWGVSDVARRLGASGPRTARLAVATPLLGAHFISGAHNDALMVAGVVTGFALALRGWFVRAALLVALGAMVKVTAVVALPFVALLWAAARARTSASAAPGEAAVDDRDRVRLRMGEVGATLALTAVTAAIAMALLSRLTGLGLAWLNPGATPGRNEQWTSLPTAIGMAVGAVGHVLGRPEWRDTAIGVARVVGLVVLAVVLVLLWLGAAKEMARTDRRDGFDGRDGVNRRRADAAGVVTAAGFAFLALIVLSPAFLGWYFLWALPLLAVGLGAGPRPANWRESMLDRWLPIAATVLCFAQLPDGYSLGLTTTAVGVPIALVATVLLLRAALRWSRRVDWRRVLDPSVPLTRDPEEAARPGGPAWSAPGTQSDWHPDDASPRGRRRLTTLLLALPVLAVVGFAVWALTARVASDDLETYETLRFRLRGIEQRYPPIGDASRPPCGVTDEGWLELTWGSLTGPSVEEVETYLRAFAWQPVTTEPGTVLRLDEGGRELTARITPPTGDVGVRLTGTSEASSFACLLH
jgi:alpha-1,6-mannosyltransferase